MSFDSKEVLGTLVQDVPDQVPFLHEGLHEHCLRVADASWPEATGNKLCIAFTTVIITVAQVKKAMMHAIGVNNDHACGLSSFRDFEAQEAVVSKVYDVLEVDEASGLEELTILALDPIKVEVAMFVLNAIFVQ